MNESHHGDITLTIDEHDGVIEYVLDIDHVQLADGSHLKLRISDDQARDALHCFEDVFPYTARLSQTPPPKGVFEIPLKPCGCGVLLGEVCDCALAQADAEKLFASPLWLEAK